MLGGDTTQAQSNYFGKGNTTTYDRGQFHDVASPQTMMNTYAVNWTNTSTTWMVNGNVVRTLNFADAVGGTNYPQTPCNIRIGNWVGGDPSNSPGTIQWAGGPANMAQGPFNLIVQSIKVTNYNPAQSYKYKDTSGSFESIEILDIVATFTGTSSSGSGKGSGTSNSTNGGQVSQVPVGSTVTIDTATAPGAAATGSSKLTGNANAGGDSSTVTVDLGSSATAAPASNSSGGGLVAAGVPANVTHSTVTINLGSAGAARTNATGGASFVPTATGAGGTAAPAQVSTSAANILTGGSGLVTALLILMGIGLALA
jgi:hypothetical protein